MDSDRELIQLELKYCERCGGLWFRMQCSPEVYCATCAIAMADVALPSKSRRHPRMPVADDFEGRGISEITAWMEGGNA
jgi:hypothetical protein